MYKSITCAKTKTTSALITAWAAHSLSPVAASAVSAWAAAAGRGVMCKERVVMHKEQTVWSLRASGTSPFQDRGREFSSCEEGQDHL